MPLHRRDLVSAEEGSLTFVGPKGDRINWKKFEILGEVLLPIMKSQGTPYPNLQRNEVSRELILDCRMETDDEVSCAPLIDSQELRLTSYAEYISAKCPSREFFRRPI